VGDSFKIDFKWVRSLATIWRALDLEAAEKSEPAYLPEGVSLIAGGLCPEY